MLSVQPRADPRDREQEPIDNRLPGDGRGGTAARDHDHEGSDHADDQEVADVVVELHGGEGSAGGQRRSTVTKATVGTGASAGKLLPAHVERLDRSLGLHVARAGGRALLRCRPRGRLGELVLERRERRLRRFDLALERDLVGGRAGAARAFGLRLPGGAVAASFAVAFLVAFGVAFGAVTVVFVATGPPADAPPRAPPRAPRGCARTPASRRRSCAGCRPRTRSCVCRPRRGARGRARRAAASPRSARARPRALRGSRGRGVGRLVEDQDVGPECTRIASDSLRRSPPESRRAASRLLS